MNDNCSQTVFSKRFISLLFLLSIDAFLIHKPPNRITLLVYVFFFFFFIIIIVVCTCTRSSNPFFLCLLSLEFFYFHFLFVSVLIVCGVIGHNIALNDRVVRLTSHRYNKSKSCSCRIHVIDRQIAISIMSILAVIYKMIQYIPNNINSSFLLIYS